MMSNAHIVKPLRVDNHRTQQRTANSRVDNHSSHSNQKRKAATNTQTHSNQKRKAATNTQTHSNQKAESRYEYANTAIDMIVAACDLCPSASSCGHLRHVCVRHSFEINTTHNPCHTSTQHQETLATDVIQQNEGNESYHCQRAHCMMLSQSAGKTGNLKNASEPKARHFLHHSMGCMNSSRSRTLHAKQKLPDFVLQLKRKTNVCPYSCWLKRTPRPGNRKSFGDQAQESQILW